MILLEIGVTPVKIESVFFIIFIVVVTLILSSLSSKPSVKPIWNGYKTFWLMLLAILSVNFVKKEVKQWWDKN